MIGGAKRKRFAVVSNIGAMHEARREFAAEVRAARALLGWSQAELSQRVGVTQRSINRLENADLNVRRSTAVAIEGVLRDQGISFEMVSSGGFRILVLPRRKRLDRD